jgi:hypothetical protein
MSDESKYESACAALVLVAFVAIIITAPWWMPAIDEALEPRQIVVMECAR